MIPVLKSYTKNKKVRREKNEETKKIISAGVALCMAAGCVSCSKNKETSESPVNLVWYMLGPQKAGIEEVNEKINEYTLEKLGCTITLINIPTDYTSKLRLSIARGEEFDIAFTANTFGFYEFATKKAFMPLGDLLDEYGKGIKEILPDYFYPSATVNGKLYAIPAYKDAAQESVISYNLALAEQYSVDSDSIKELKDLEPYMAAFKKDHPNEYPLGLTGYVWKYFYDFTGYIPVSGDRTLCMYTDMDGDETKIMNPFISEKTREYLDLMYDWYSKGYIQKDAATADSIPEETMFSGGEILPYQQETNNRTKAPELQRGIIHIRGPVMTTTAGSMQAISSSSKHPEKAMEFLNLLNTDAYLRNLVTYGIEGKHFVKLDDLHYKYPEGVDAADVDYSSYQYTIGNGYLKYQPEGTPDDIYEKYHEFDENSYKSPTLGFYLDPAPISNELAAVQNVYAEYGKSLMTGSVDPEKYLPEFLEKLNAAGYEKVLTETQKQYDEWRGIK